MYIYGDFNKKHVYLLDETRVYLPNENMYIYLMKTWLYI